MIISKVHDVLLIEDKTYTRKILVNGYDKPVSEEVLMKVSEVFSCPENIVLGHRFTVGIPTYITLNLKLDLKVEYEFEDELIIKRLQAFFNGGLTDDGFDFNGLGIGEKLNIHFFYSAIESMDGVLEASAKVLDDGSDIKDITVNATEVLKLGEVSITKTLVDK